MTPSLLEGNVLFRALYCLLAASEGNGQFCTPGGAAPFRDGWLPAGWEWLAFAVVGLVISFLLLSVFLVLLLLYTYVERRLLGRFQGRLGPNRTGPFGLLQPVADGIKILSKEDTVPEGADRWVFNLAPVVMALPVFLVLAVIPFGKDSFLADINVAVLYILAVTSISTLAMFMAGFASANRYAMFGGMRAVAQLISYEIPVVLSIVGVVLMAGSMSLTKIVEAQQWPFLLLQPLAFIIFVVASSAEMNRPPFDLMEAESEIVSGYHIEYAGMKFGLFWLAEYGAVLTNSGIMATLFLKGWEGPLLPSHLWFLIKVFSFAFVFIWIRATLPRLRIDQVMAFAWKFLLPLSLINVFITATEVLWLGEVVTQDGWSRWVFSGADLSLMAGINLVVAVAGIVVFGKLVRLGEAPARVASAPLPMEAS